MSPFTCPREAETIRLAWSGAWPAGCDDDLSEHLRSCAVCREAIELAGAFRENREAAAREARVPASGLVWWRAQLRARREAAVLAERPVALAQWLAIAAGLAAAGAVAWALIPSLRGVLGGLAAILPARADLVPSLPVAPGIFSNLSGWSVLAQPAILIVLAATLLLAPVAVYLAVAKE